MKSLNESNYNKEKNHKHFNLSLDKNSQKLEQLKLTKSNEKSNESF
jgi:hypothetical protein